MSASFREQLSGFTFVKLFEYISDAVKGKIHGPKGVHLGRVVASLLVPITFFPSLMVDIFYGFKALACRNIVVVNSGDSKLSNTTRTNGASDKSTQPSESDQTLEELNQNKAKEYKNNQPPVIQVPEELMQHVLDQYDRNKEKPEKTEKEKEQEKAYDKLVNNYGQVADVVEHTSPKIETAVKHLQSITDYYEQIVNQKVKSTLFSTKKNNIKSFTHQQIAAFDSLSIYTQGLKTNNTLALENLNKSKDTSLPQSLIDNETEKDNENSNKLDLFRYALIIKKQISQIDGFIDSANILNNKKIKKEVQQNAKAAKKILEEVANQYDTIKDHLDHCLQADGIGTSKKSTQQSNITKPLESAQLGKSDQALEELNQNKDKEYKNNQPQVIQAPEDLTQHVPESA